MISIAQALKDATKAISDKQISDTPLLDATLLLMHVTNYRREQLYLHSQQPLSKEHFEQFNNLVNQRLDYEPIAYLTNKREFYKHTFKVTKDVLIPRSDSEIIVEQALILLKDNDKVLDLATGSGALGISLASENPTIELTLSDISTKALAVAKENSLVILNKEVTIIHSDLFMALQNKSFNMIITNPPYLSASWYEDVEPQVKKEPKLALIDKGEDGLHIIGKIVESSPYHLEEGGTLLIECDWRQNDKVAKLMKKRGFTQINQINDYRNLRTLLYGENTMHEQLVNRFIQKAFRYSKSEQQRIAEAARFAAIAHGEQKRLSGEPYIIHPFAVGEILMSLSMDVDTVVAGVLHDTLEDTDVTYDQLVEKFGETVAELVEGETKISALKAKNKSQQEAETIRKMFFAMAEDVRVIIIKLADKLHNMRTLQHLSPVRAKEIANECLDIFAPLADRLGMSWLKGELEDQALKILKPETFDYIEGYLLSKRVSGQPT